MKSVSSDLRQLDYVRIVHSGSQWTSSPTYYTGRINDSGTSLWTWTILEPYRLTGFSEMQVFWNADSSVNGDANGGYAPPGFSQLAVQCYSDQTTTASNGLALSTNQRYEGLLLATNDVIYAAVTQPTNVAFVISLEGLVPGTDFDLYASTTTSTYPVGSCVPGTSSSSWDAVQSQITVYSPPGPYSSPDPTIHYNNNQLKNLVNVTFH